ncbi:F-box/LRR-repeat protein 12-like [Rutidosis leptorrhynchoides]|uniref:F-box/LRR-repeat protein 12-like n=1 Tax=Rutidosis leptorrhynchoides TaxID=125765 RepID=UPI003A9A1344
MDVSDDRKQSLCITQLPDEVLDLIYQKLYLARDEESFSQTCHRFLDITILSCKCFNDVVRSNPFDSIVVGRCLHFFSHHFESHYSSWISVLDLSFTVITDKGLETLTKYSNKLLINVSLICCLFGVRSRQGFSAALTYLEADSRTLYPTGYLSGAGLEYLKVFNFSKLYKDERGLAAIGSGIAKNLKVLSFWARSFVTDDSIIKISKGCPLLQELNLAFCIGIGLRGWVSIGLHCQNLETLHVNYSDTTSVIED